MARHDGLTNLPNRYAFRERIRDALKAATDDGAMLAVMCVDLDNFKEVNDTLGHPTGDALLCAVAERLARNVRETDMVARFGGDEFAILQARVERLDDADRLAARLVGELRKPFLINGEPVYATGSIGVAISPRHGNDADVLQKNADLALYAAKADGKRVHRFFESVMHERLTNRHVLERDLRQAVASGELQLNYQPIVHLRTMRMTGLEALLRWTHPVHGVVPPSKFIPVAEDTGPDQRDRPLGAGASLRRRGALAFALEGGREPFGRAVHAGRHRRGHPRRVEPRRAQAGASGRRDHRVAAAHGEHLDIGYAAPVEGASHRSRDGRLRNRVFVAELPYGNILSTASRSTVISSAPRGRATRTRRSSEPSSSWVSRSA